MSELKYPIGIESFEKLRTNDMVYVDKTDIIYQLVKQPRSVFLSRPRRFGKSLLLSTIAAYFEGRRELFEGLAISHYENDWVCHPVFHLNFVNAYTDSEEGLNVILDVQLNKWEELYGRNEVEMTPAQRFYGVIERAVALTGQPAVVLIDEYDKFLVATLDQPSLHEHFRSMLKPLYATLKAADKYLRFSMITGVTRFSRLSIFSDLNNLRDISLNEDFGTICGISEEEIRDSLLPGVEALAKRLNLSLEATFRRLKENYDGYHFTAKPTDLYNPFSLLNVLEDKKMSDYWFATGTPTFLLEALRNKEGMVRDFFHTEAPASSLEDISYFASDPMAMLFQTGYLTIKNYNEREDLYTLGIPNGEVRRGLMKGLLPIFAGKNIIDSDSFINKFVSEVKRGETEKFLLRLKSFLANIPYDLSKNQPEVYFENNLYIIFKLVGMNVETEYRTSAGRVDIVIKVPDYIYVIELKLRGTANSALQQINERQYTLPFAGDGRRIFKIGISFSTRTRNISRWIIEAEH